MPLQRSRYRIHQFTQCARGLASELRRQGVQIANCLSGRALVTDQLFVRRFGIVGNAPGVVEKFLQLALRLLAHFAAFFQVGAGGIEGLLAGALEPAPLALRRAEATLVAGQYFLLIELLPATAQLLQTFGDGVRMQIFGVDFAHPLDQALAKLIVGPVLPVAHFLELAGHLRQAAGGLVGAAFLRQSILQAARCRDGFV